MRWHLVSLDSRALALVCLACWSDYQQTIQNSIAVLARSIAVVRLELGDVEHPYLCSVCRPTTANTRRAATV